jgi:hypothetical protein
VRLKSDTTASICGPAAAHTETRRRQSDSAVATWTRPIHSWSGCARDSAQPTGRSRDNCVDRESRSSGIAPRRYRGSVGGLVVRRGWVWRADRTATHSRWSAGTYVRCSTVAAQRRRSTNVVVQDENCLLEAAALRSVDVSAARLRRRSRVSARTGRAIPLHARSAVVR